ncbi:MAG: ABC transporter ATP-binding protein, partial [Planctomycetota bacterium]|nr:ABC transporter ATP-binding protein [Planctomycetota bacterium]
MYAAEIRDLHKYYDLGAVVVKALRGVTAEFPKGDFVAIMGASGSGKSTLLNILGALDRPTDGQYILGGEDTSTLSDDDLSAIRNEMIGFIFQSYNLIPQFTVLENIAVPLQYQRRKGGVGASEMDWCTELADRVGLADRLDHRPTQLSGGQQQRVAIARSLVNDPQIILADEPTGNLDSETEAEIMQVLIDLNNEGRTILMVTHENEVAALAKRQLHLKDGQKVFDGIVPENGEATTRSLPVASAPEVVSDPAGNDESAGTDV